MNSILSNSVESHYFTSLMRMQNKNKKNNEDQHNSTNYKTHDQKFNFKIIKMKI